jgi:hypothetical protein
VAITVAVLEKGKVFLSDLAHKLFHSSLAPEKCPEGVGIGLDQNAVRSDSIIVRMDVDDE